MDPELQVWPRECNFKELRRWSDKLPKPKENGLYFFIAHVGKTTQDMHTPKSNIFLGHFRTTYILE